MACENISLVLLYFLGPDRRTLNPADARNPGLDRQKPMGSFDTG
jgi:hypothetical protein